MNGGTLNGSQCSNGLPELSLLSAQESSSTTMDLGPASPVVCREAKRSPSSRDSLVMNGSSQMGREQ